MFRRHYPFRFRRRKLVMISSLRNTICIITTFIIAVFVVTVRYCYIAVQWRLEHDISYPK